MLRHPAFNSPRKRYPSASWFPYAKAKHWRSEVINILMYAKISYIMLEGGAFVNTEYYAEYGCIRVVSNYESNLIGFRINAAPYIN